MPALAFFAGVASLLLAVGPFADPSTSFSETHMSSRCEWRIDTYRVHGELDGITAFNRRNIWAVGVTNDDRPLALHWLGAGWSAVRMPVKNGPFYVTAAAFVTGNDGWAVGKGVPNDAIEHWDGQAWTVVPGADLGSRRVELIDVAALGRDQAWAVGLSGDGVTGKALVERWNGTRWEVVPTPNVGQSGLIAVAAISRNNVWAVGGTPRKLLIEHWNGRRWRLVTTPAPRATPRAIAALSARDIWAVGDDGSVTHRKTLVEHWDGMRWRVVSSPVLRGTLNSIAAVSSRDIWVSGERATGRGTILAHRLGGTWRIVRPPRIKGQFNLLVAAAARNDIWAVVKTQSQSDPTGERDVLGHYTCRP